LKPLFDKSLAKDKVMCIDLNDTMEFLLAGYESGALALFDMKTYKLIKVLNEVHGSEVLSAKIYFVDEESNSVRFLSMEIDGAVCCCKVSTTKGMFKKPK
jgi:hypothetical protein